MPPAAPLGSVSGIEFWPKTLPFGRTIASALGAPAHHPAVRRVCPVFVSLWLAKRPLDKLPRQFRTLGIIRHAVACRLGFLAVTIRPTGNGWSGFTLCARFGLW